MKKLINFIHRGANQFITNGVWRMAVYRDGKLIDINQTANVSAADPFIWQKKDGSFTLLFEPIHLLKNLRGEEFTLEISIRTVSVYQT